MCPLRPITASIISPGSQRPQRSPNTAMNKQQAWKAIHISARFMVPSISIPGVRCISILNFATLQHSLLKPCVYSAASRPNHNICAHFRTYWHLYILNEIRSGVTGLCCIPAGQIWPCHATGGEKPLISTRFMKMTDLSNGTFSNSRF